MKLKSKLIPLKDCLPSSKESEMAVLLKLSAGKAPKRKSKKRAPLNLALALDRSSSMGRQMRSPVVPFEEVRKAAIAMVERLEEGDRLAVISYGNDAVIEVPSTPITKSSKPEIIAQLKRMRCNGMTALHDGWLAAAEEIAEHLAKEGFARVLLLSDGCANRGLDKTEEICPQVAALAEKGITTSTYGLGFNFHEDLMAGMAKSGQGQAFYGETAEDLLPNLETELGLLSSQAAKNLRLKVTPAGKSVEVDCLNDYARGAGGEIFLPNLIYGAEAWAVLQVKTRNLKKAAGKKLLTISVEMEDMEGSALAPVKLELKLPVVAKKDFEAASENAEVAERLKEVTAAKLQDEAKFAARRGDFAGVKKIAGTIAGMAGNNAYVRGIGAEMGRLADTGDANLISKQATFASAAMTRRYSIAGEDVAIMDASPFDLRKAAQGKVSQTGLSQGQPGDKGRNRGKMVRPGVG